MLICCNLSNNSVIEQTEGSHRVNYWWDCFFDKRDCSLNHGVVTNNTSRFSKKCCINYVFVVCVCVCVCVCVALNMHVYLHRFEILYVLTQNGKNIHHLEESIGTGFFFFFFFFFLSSK